MRICIDPGHGGYDPGAVGPSVVQEKYITLVVALKLAELLRSAGVEVLLTRESDEVSWPSNTSKDLAARVKMANDWGADLFVSIHCNSFSASSHGTETFCYKFGGQGEAVASAVQKKLVSALGLTDRGVKEANYYVLRKTSMTAILTELAFISNPKEEALLNTDVFQTKAAAAIFDGVAEVYELGKNNGDDIKIRIGDKTLNGKLIDSVAYAPVRQLIEAANRKVEWDDKTKTVTII